MKVSCLFILLSYNKSAWRLRCVVSGDPWENLNSNLRVYVAKQGRHGSAGYSKFSQAKISGVQFYADNE